MNKIFFGLLSLLFLAACGPVVVQKADSLRKEQTEQLMQEAVKQVPIPNVTNFAELRNATYLIELRDKNVATYTYIVTLDGRFIHLCDSVGFGMPASVQITAPVRTGLAYGEAVLLPQPEPNGLFMPEGLAATYVTCVNPDGGAPTPMYVEPEIIVSTTKLH